MMSQKLAEINERVRLACESVKRETSTVRIVAVSKGQEPGAIVDAYRLGVRDFGENYAAELKQKQAALAQECPEIRWHFLGRIQSNKARVISTCRWVHTLDNVEHSKLLSKMVIGEEPINALLQVNLDKDEQRSGVFPETVLEHYAQIKKQKGLNLCGLMTIAPQMNGFAPGFWFKRMQELKTALEQELKEAVPELSMGMSGDFEEAICYGATWIRVGTLLFGERKSKSND